MGTTKIDCSAMTPPPADQHIKEFVAEQIRLCATHSILYPEMLKDARWCIEQTVGGLLVLLDTYVLGMPKEKLDVEEKWPCNWWEAFRERWFPAWWLRRWPVRYREISLHQTLYGRVCPHIRMPETKPHLEWLSQKEE